MPFSVTGQPQAGQPAVATGINDESQDTQSNSIAQLKLQAVSEWLHTYLGSRFSQYEHLLTTDFAEKYAVHVCKVVDGVRIYTDLLD